MRNIDQPQSGDELATRVAKLENIVRRLQQNDSPTIPSYDQTNFPQDAVYGQIAKDYNDHTMWVYGEDDSWHQIGVPSGAEFISAPGVDNQTIGASGGSAKIQWDTASGEISSNSYIYWYDDYHLAWNANPNFAAVLLLYGSTSFYGSAGPSDNVVVWWGHALAAGTPTQLSNQPLNTIVTLNGFNTTNQVFGVLPIGRNTSITGGGICLFMTNENSTDMLTHLTNMTAVYIPVSDPSYNLNTIL